MKVSEMNMDSRQIESLIIVYKERIDLFTVAKNNPITGLEEKCLIEGRIRMLHDVLQDLEIELLKL